MERGDSPNYVCISLSEAMCISGSYDLCHNYSTLCIHMHHHFINEEIPLFAKRTWFKSRAGNICSSKCSLLTNRSFTKKLEWEGVSEVGVFE